jgi:anti-anti-sigma factor
VESSPSFTALLHEVQGVPVLKVSGELDLHSTSRFQDALEKAVAGAEHDEGSVHALVVDLSEAGFMDSMALGALMGSTQEFREGGGEVRLVVLGGEVLRLLEVTGLDEALPVYPDALTAVRGRRSGV